MLLEVVRRALGEFSPFWSFKLKELTLANILDKQDLIIFLIAQLAPKC